MPVIPPGETGELVLPGDAVSAASADPGTPGERWLTLSFRTTDAEPWADAGHEVGWQQVRLPGDPVRTASTVDPDAPSPLDADGLPSHPFLASSPGISLWRAPTDNDRIGGMGAAWEAHGLARLERRLVGVERVDDGWLVTADLVTGSGATVRHERIVRVVAAVASPSRSTWSSPTSSRTCPAWAPCSRPRPGSTGSRGSAPGRTRPTPTGSWPGSVGSSPPCGTSRCPISGPRRTAAAPRSAGWRSSTRRAGACRIVLDRPRQASVLSYRAEELAAADHQEELVPRGSAVIHLDAAHRGLGTASCGPDTLSGYLIGPGSHRWSWTLEPIGTEPPVKAGRRTRAATSSTVSPRPATEPASRRRTTQQAPASRKPAKPKAPAAPRS